MRYRSFEELPVWNAAIEMAAEVFALAENGRLSRYAGLKDQIERAAVSVSNNIAEGFERGTHDELLTFLYYALGSAGEVRSMLHLLRRVSIGSDLGPRLDDLLPRVRDVSRQLNAWIESLKDSARRGPRFENSDTRAARERVRRGQDFLKELERIKNQGKTTEERGGEAAGDDGV